jgi:deoxyribodipyrimidine photolyase-related protein
MIAVVLGDQLDLESPALEACDAVIMVEAAEESRRVRSHKARTILFFSAMRHFAASLRERGLTVHYRSIEQGCLSQAIGRSSKRCARLVRSKAESF